MIVLRNLIFLMACVAAVALLGLYQPSNNIRSRVNAFLYPNAEQPYLEILQGATTFKSWMVAGIHTPFPAEAQLAPNDFGYSLIVSTVGMLGVLHPDPTAGRLRPDPKTLQQIQLGIFFLLSAILALAVGSFTESFFLSSFLLFCGLAFFRYHNQTYLIDWVGIYTLGTIFPLLSATLAIAMMYAVRRYSLLAIAVLGGLCGALAGALSLLRISVALSLLLTIVLSIAVVTLSHAIVAWRSEGLLLPARKASRGIIAVVLCVTAYLVSPTGLIYSLVHYRAEQTGLEPRLYGPIKHDNGGLAWIMSLGRYPNSYGFFAADSSSFGVINELLGRSKNDTRSDAAFWHASNKFALEWSLQHPSYAAYVLGHAILDYALFLPYAFFLDDRTPQRSIVNSAAFLPALTSAIQDSDRAYAGVSATEPDARPPHIASLVNLHLSYFYLTPLEWTAFALMAFIFFAGPVFFYRLAPAKLWLCGAIYLSFFCHSLPRVISPLYGGDALLGFWLCIVFNTVGLADEAKSLLTRWWHAAMSNHRLR